MPSVDILMVTYDRPEYVQQSLGRLLETCDDSMRVWLWHNGEDRATLDTTRSFATHPRVAAFHHSPENVRLRAPTNWLWANATGDYVSKIDDDCLVEPGWAHKLAAAHEANPAFGVIGSWRFFEEDFVPRLARRKIRSFSGGHQLMLNCWVQGSGYLMKRSCIEEQGLLGPEQNFSEYCVDLVLKGYVNGWYFPFIHEEHMDDPRSRFTGLKTDDDLRRRLPLSAAERGVTTLLEWEAQMRRSARRLQAASPNPRNYVGVRGRAHFLLKRLSAALA